MGEKQRHSLSFARAVALELADILRPSCHEIEIAGSIRRGRPDVGDIELVMRPRVEGVADPSDLLGIKTVDLNHQWELASKLRADGVLRDRHDVNGRPAFGQRMQRCVFRGIPVDLFCVLPPAQFGVIMFIRTGPKEFSHRCLTQLVEGGKVLQMGQRVVDGVLLDRGAVIQTPTELDFFRAVGLDYLEPKDRA